MAAPVMSAPHFHNEEAAFAFVEARLWANGPVCPHCGGTARIRPLKGKTTRVGLRKCYDCRKNFTVRHGTVFEDSHLDLHIWLQAIHLICSSKKGFSSNQLHRILGCTLKTAWFLSHRIREAMRTGGLAPMGGAGGIVESDETYVGRKEGKKVGRGYAHKRVVLALVERGGQTRSFHIDKTNIAEILPIVRDNVAKEATLMTDEGTHYERIGAMFAGHETVNHHAEEYVRGQWHTNTIEGVFSIFKRGMYGIYQHCGEQHLHRYLAEFDFRYNNRIRLGVDDTTRAENALLGVVGKRLTYRTTVGSQAP